MPNAKSTKKIDADISDVPEVAIYGSTDGGSTWVALQIDTDGAIVLSRDDLSDYFPSDIEYGTPNYYGFVDKDGNWYIQRDASGGTEFRYVKGSTDYTTNWTGRAGLSYGYFYDVF